MAWDHIAPIIVIMGQDGLWAIRNKNRVPIGSFRTLRNATLEDDSLRTMGGAVLLGSTVGASLTIQAAIDFWPDLSTQRTLVSLSDGTLFKDDGLGGNWTSLATGLTASGQVPQWVIGGAEAAGRTKKAFHCDRINAVRVLSADGASMTTIANPPADWNGANQPGFLAHHDGCLWGGGNANAPKTLYKSDRLDHENFLAFPYVIFVSGDYERLVAALSYKGGLLVWGYPSGVWWINTLDPNQQNWRPIRVGAAGAMGPGNVLAIEDDVLWVSPAGSIHLISATQAEGSVRAEDLAPRKLGNFISDEINVAQLATAQWVYYATKQVAMLACHAVGQTTKNRVLVFDVRRRMDPNVGERWILHDRDRNEALFLRKISEVLTPTFGDNVGQLWTLDRPDRTANALGYTFEWQLNEQDFSSLMPQWAGRKLNGRFLQIEYDPRSTVNHAIDVIKDAAKTQTITFTLTPTGPTLDIPSLPVTLTEDTLTMSQRRRMVGQSRRWAFRGVSSAPGADVSLTRLLIGLEVAA